MCVPGNHKAKFFMSQNANVGDYVLGLDNYLYLFIWWFASKQIDICLISQFLGAAKAKALTLKKSENYEG